MKNNHLRAKNEGRKNRAMVVFFSSHMLLVILINLLFHMNVILLNNLFLGRTLEL